MEKQHHRGGFEMKLKTILGLTIPQIAWMKKYFIERLIEIPNIEFNSEIIKKEYWKKLKGEKNET